MAATKHLQPLACKGRLIDVSDSCRDACKKPGGGSQPSATKTCERTLRELVKRRGKSHVYRHPQRPLRADYGAPGARS